jgi:hypothetical protein
VQIEQCRRWRVISGMIRHWLKAGSAEPINR